MADTHAACFRRSDELRIRFPIRAGGMRYDYVCHRARLSDISMAEKIAEDVQRFILTSIPSVPHLEALLLLRGDTRKPWSIERMAQRLYVSDKTANQLLTDLCNAGVLVRVNGEDSRYRYQPNSEELNHMIERVAIAYSHHIVEVANLIHSKTGKKAQNFADAFKWRKD